MRVVTNVAVGMVVGVVLNLAVVAVEFEQGLLRELL
jgi:hypothetical protein